MTPARSLRPALLLVAALLVPLVLAGCAASAHPQATSDPAPDAVTPDTVTPEGAAGAAEVAEPARALVVADARGELTLLDLATDKRSIIAEAGGEFAALDGTGRFLLLTRERGGESTVDIVDAGRWTQPHGDHSHYFLGAPRDLGAVQGAGRATVGVGADATVIRFDGDPEVVVLPHEELAKAGADAATRVAAEAVGPVVSVAGTLVAATAEGIAVPDLAAVPCAAASDVDATRVGTVYACAEGAVLVRREVGGAVGAESIPYPEGAPAASVLAGRPDRPDLAGPAGDQGAWLLDVRARTWTLLPSDVPLVRVAAVGDDASRTVVVDAEGRVRILGADGSVLARTDPLVAESVAAEGMQLLVDGDHAYVGDPSGGAVLEIDLGGGSVTRTFTGLQPRALALVG
ncbi:hypothetical protein MHM582_3011 [Microbacterium sp. HM58-2]|nr:hypothetical protein MHM582_3011 [Microbacterium sp. HM58-2]